MKKTSNVLPLSMFLLGILSISPVFYWIGIRSLYINYGLFIFIIFLINTRQIKIKLSFIISAGILVFLSGITALKWGLSFNSIFEQIPLILSVLLLIISNEIEHEIFIDIATVFVSVLIVLSWIGMIIYFIGKFNPVVLIDQFDRSIYYYLTTLSYQGLNIIRPSGIYDEPGTMSYIICSVVVFRKIFNKDLKTDWFLIIGGLITLSVSHVLCLILFFIVDIRKFKSNMTIPILIVFSILIFVPLLNDYSFYEFTSRFDIDDAGRFAGDNRADRLISAYKYLNVNNFIFGLDGSLFEDFQKAKNNYDEIGENVLSPILTKGLLISFPYYVILLLLLWISFTDSLYFPCIVIFALLLQRPYATIPGYSLLSTLPIVLFYKRKNHLEVNELK